MGASRVYSERLGRIRDGQFEAVAERLGLGRFVGAEPATAALLGQNVLFTTMDGAFALRGAPHWVKGIHEAEWRREDCWQFAKKTFFARQQEISGFRARAGGPRAKLLLDVYRHHLPSESRGFADALTPARTVQDAPPADWS